MSKAKQIPRTVRDLLKERSGGVCEVRVACEGSPAAQMHHRRPRGMGGSRDGLTNLPSNLLHICFACHHHIETHRLDALDNGWLVRQGAQPQEISVVTYNGRWRLSDTDTSYLPLSYPEWVANRQCFRKTPFKSKSEAVSWARKNEWLRGRLEAYECPTCAQWHLTKGAA